MIGRLLQASLRNRTIVLFCAILLTIWGGWTAIHMPIDVFPDISAPTVTVVTEAHGMAPQEMEMLITLPIETSLNGAPGVRRIRSSSAMGISLIWVEFEWGTDIYRARQIINERVQLVGSSLPDETEPPILAPISSVMGEILFLALHSETHSPMDLRTTAEWVLRKRLLAIPGIAQAVVLGGDEKQYQVRLDPWKMDLHGVTWKEVADALSESNRNAAAGIYTEGAQEYLIRGIGRAQHVEDLKKTVIALRKNIPVLVEQVAEVVIAPAFKRGVGAFNGESAVILSVQKQPDANTLDLTERLDGVLNEVEKSLPQGMKLERDIFRQSEFIKVAIHNILEALRDGSVLVVVILFLFLASTRGIFITLTAIPLSLLATFLAMKWTGATINTMTLGGMAIAIGDLVDDAIIDVENVFRRLKENRVLPASQQKTAMEVVLSASQEIRGSIVFATMIILMVFTPLFFLPGLEGRLLRPLGFAYIISLFCSLIVAVTVTPVLCYWLLPKSKGLLKSEDTRFALKLKSWYQPILEKALKHPLAVISIAVLLFCAALVCFPFFGRSFLPSFNEGTLTIGATTLAGVSLEESNKIASRIDRILKSFPEVKNFARRTGRAEKDEHAQGVERSEWEVTLKDAEHERPDLLAELRHDFSLIPGVEVEIGQPISHRIDHMLSGTRANLAVKIFGDDLNDLRRVSSQIKGVMSHIPGVVDLVQMQQPDIPILQVSMDRAALARYGIRPEQVADTMETAFVGKAVSKILEGSTAFDLVVMTKELPRDDQRVVENLLLDTAHGSKIPLRLVAKMTRSSGPNLIDRENVQRKSVVSCNVAGRDLQSVVDDIRKQVEASVQLPTGMFIEYGGQFEAQEAASRRLLWMSLAVVVGIGFLLFTAFHSHRDVFLIMLNLPFALIGGVVGVFLSGGIISIATMVGFITLFGIATRNGIMLISHIRHLLDEEGVKSFHEAVVRGAIERMSPILMTALTAGLALLPLALGGNQPGREIQTPLATVILCGLFSSTALNMLVLPTLYLKFGKKGANHERSLGGGAS